MDVIFEQGGQYYLGRQAPPVLSGVSAMLVLSDEPLSLAEAKSRVRGCYSLYPEGVNHPLRDEFVRLMAIETAMRKNKELQKTAAAEARLEALAAEREKRQAWADKAAADLAKAITRGDLVKAAGRRRALARHQEILLRKDDQARQLLASRYADGPGGESPAVRFEKVLAA